MTPKKLGPRPLSLEELVALLDASDFEWLREEDRILPRELRDARLRVGDLREAFDKRCPEDEDASLGRLLGRRPEDPESVSPIEDLGLNHLVERMQVTWECREEEALRYGLRLGLVLGAHAQASLGEDEEPMGPLRLTTVLRAMLDVAEALDGERALREASQEERRREWRTSGKTWADFAMPGVFGSDEDGEAATG